MERGRPGAGTLDQARLTRRGVHQAGRWPSACGGHPIGALFASDLHRAVATAAPLGPVLGLRYRPRHQAARAVPRRPGGQRRRGGPAAASGLDGQRVADADARPDGGESLRDFYRRIAEFAADLAGSWPAAGGRDIAVVAHGGTLRMLSARLTGTPVEEMRWEPLGNGCILRFPAARLTAAAAG